MKTEQQVMDKLKECEDRINELLIEGVNSDFDKVRIEKVKTGRKSCLWYLSDLDSMPDDVLDYQIQTELIRYESSKIF